MRKRMRRSLWISLVIFIIFMGVWFCVASSFGPYLDEDCHFDWAYGMFKTGSVHYNWDSSTGQPIAMGLDKWLFRGFLVTYLCSLAFKIPGGTPILWCRLMMLFFAWSTFLLVAVYYKRKGVLTPQRLLTWTILFFCSSIILDNSYYVRTYTALGLAMTATFILYWEALAAFRQKKRKKALLLGVLALIPVGISIVDQWQVEGIPAFAIAIMTSIAAFNQRFSPIFGWLKQRSLWLLLGVILIAPKIVGHLSFLSWLHVGGIQMFGLYYSTYWDNIIGWVRFIITINIGLLALGYAFKSKVPMTFERWMFINGFLTGIVCILYNDVNHVFFSKYIYLPTLMMLIGLSGIIEGFFMKTSLRVCMLAVYVIINIGASWANTFEHNNPKEAIRWLNEHMTQEDILLTFNAYSTLQYMGGQELLPMTYRISDSMDNTHIIDLGKYIISHPGARIFYFYLDGYAFRTWLCKITLGRDRYPAIDLWSYLKIRIPSTPVVPGLRQGGLVEFDRAVLLNGLDQLLRQGYSHMDYRMIKFLIYKF